MTLYPYWENALRESASSPIVILGGATRNGKTTAALKLVEARVRDYVESGVRLLHDVLVPDEQAQRELCQRLTDVGVMYPTDDGVGSMTLEVRKGLVTLCFRIMAMSRIDGDLYRCRDLLIAWHRDPTVARAMFSIDLTLTSPLGLTVVESVERQYRGDVDNVLRVLLCNPRRRHLSIKLYEPSRWEVDPSKLTGREFHVRLGSRREPPRILWPHEEPAAGDISVPESYRTEFEADLIDAIIHIAGHRPSLW